MAHKKYISFADLCASEDIKLYREVETVSHRDENSANNHLFVWNFEESDLEEFIHIFTSYKNEVPSAFGRLDLKGKLFRKMNSMLREEYNPVECMLYASKTINLKLQSDRELQEIIAGMIKDIYIKHESETIRVFENIIKMWTWIPQLKITIIAIGLIGDNEELLDNILLNYAEDNQLRLNVFNAFMQNKSSSNLDRAIKMIMNLGETSDDAIIGRILKRDIIGFGDEGMKIIEKYYNNPGISRAGSKIIRWVMLKMNSQVDSDDNFYRNTLAKKSVEDDNAFNDFLADCEEKNDDKALYLCRYSRIEMGNFIRKKLEDGSLPYKNKNTAIISIACLGIKGYTPASEIINSMENDDDCIYSVMVARIILGDELYAYKLADILSEKNDYELSVLYSILRDAQLINSQKTLMLIRTALYEKFNNLLSEGGDKLDLFCSNLQMLWDKKLFNLIPNDLLIKINGVLREYAQGQLLLDENIAVSLIEVITRSYNLNVESTLFLLFQLPNRNIKELSFKKLKSRQMEAPK